MESLSRFAGRDHLIAPKPLRLPFSHKNWRALPEDLRLRHIRERVTAQIAVEHQADLEKRRARGAAKQAAAPALAEEAPAPAAVRTPSPSPAAQPRYLVACVAGCGTFHPATSARPVIVACGEREQTEKKRKHSIYDMGTEDLIARFRRESKTCTTSARTAPQAKRSAKGKAPKKRRRATCSNSH